MSAVVGTADEADTVTDAVAAAADRGPARPEVRRSSRLRRLWFVPAAVAALGGAALIPTLGGGGVGPGEARLEVAGTATITDPDGEVTEAHDTSVVVGPGTVVEVTGGTTRFEMADGVRLEGVAAGAVAGRAGTTVEMGVTPTLVSGRLLAEAPEPLSVAVGEARTHLAPAGDEPAVARLALRRGLTVGTYRGDVRVESASRTAPVQPLRRREVAAPGALGRDGLPLRYRADDPWDRRFLGEALSVDAQLAPLLATLPPAVAERLTDAVELRDVVDGLPRPATLAPLVEGVGSGGDALVLAAIATSAPGAVAEEWTAAHDLRTAGAGWGLVAVDREAWAATVIETVRHALDALGHGAPPLAEDAGGEPAAAAAVDGDVAPPPDGPDPATGGPAPGTDPVAPDAPVPSGSSPSSPASPPPSVDPVDPGGGGQPGGPPPTEPGDPGGGGDPVGEVVDGVGGTVGEVVDGVGGAVGGVVDGAGDVVDGVVDGVGGVVDGVGGTVDGVVGGLGGAVGGLTATTGV